MNCIQYWSFVLLLRLHLEYADYVESRILLESFIKAEIRTHEICSVPSDGLCILRAFKECNESVSGELIAMEDLKDRLRTEMSLSVNQTLYPDICVSDEINQFLKNPLACYNSDVCDMFLAALGNTFKVNIKVFQSDCQKCCITDLSDKQKRYNTTLYFARSLSPHVDAIIPKRLTASQRLSNEVHSFSVFLLLWLPKFQDVLVPFI